MRLPDDLNSALSHELATVPRSALTAASEELSKRYRSAERDKKPVFMTTLAHRLAYLAVRMPATYAVVRTVLEEIKHRIPDFAPHSLLDVGAGPGTATWAAINTFPELTLLALHEKDSAWLELGERLMRKSACAQLNAARWSQRDITQNSVAERHDLVIMSYVIGELPLEKLGEVISQTWQSVDHVLVVIEPGTPHGFERIRLARELLIQAGGWLVAPCPHCKACPMPSDDWCHFSKRLERSSIHMSVKDVGLGYEDEKYSYVVAAREPIVLPEARILRHPQIHSGHVDMFVCAQNGLEKRIISRRQGEVYKKARKLDWGDTL